MVRGQDPQVVKVLNQARIAARKSDNPVFVHLVNNGVVGDSRVIKAAEVSRSLGFPTVILGITRDDQPQGLSVEGSVAVLVPFFPKQRLGVSIQKWRRRIIPIMALRVLKRARNAVRHRPGPPWRQRERSRPEWSKDRNHNLRMSVSFAEALEALAPTIIHVHDAQPLPAAVAYASASRLRGRPVRVVYDAHECIPVQAKVFADLPFHRTRAVIERTYIRDVDQVLTVSDQIADLLQRTYKLPGRPGVVTNAPVAQRATDAPVLRERIGLAAEVPLAVYSGWVADIRGVDDAVAALAHLPELHLAVVTDTTKRNAATLTRLARRFGVLDRVHFTDYVLPSQVTAYLASADIGLIPLKKGRHFDLSLPTKYREYLHAGLPLVVSSNEAMATETQRTGVGEVFDSGSVPELVEALTKVLADPQRYRDAITPEVLEQNSWEAQTAVLKKHYLALSPTPPRSEDASPLTQALHEQLQDHFVEDGQAARAKAAPAIPGISLLIGRANYAGQAYHWSEAASAAFGIASSSLGSESSICHAPHRLTLTDHRDLARACEELQWVVNNHTHVLIDAFLRLFGDLLGEDVGNEIAVLRHHGLRLGLIAHGSEIRDPAAHQQWLPESYFGVAPRDWVAKMTTFTARNKQSADRFDGPLFVSTPDLLNDLPQATWLPLVIDYEQWGSLPESEQRPVPRVLHRPSRTVPPIKGSEVIVPVLEGLHERGIIDYISDPGTVAAADMPALLAQCDIVVDQIRTGSYGVAAAEGMAAGRVVVGNVHPQVREFVGDEIPIVDGSPENFEQAIIALAEDPDRRVHLAQLGRRYAQKWHSGTAAAEALSSFLRG